MPPPETEERNVARTSCRGKANATAAEPKREAQPAASPNAPAEAITRTRTPARQSIDLTESEPKEASGAPLGGDTSPLAQMAIPRTASSVCTADLTTRPVTLRMSRDVIWAINDAARQSSKPMNGLIHHKVYNPGGTRLCETDSVLSNHYIRSACEAARVPASELRCARGVHCRFVHRCEDTAGGKQYQTLLHKDWDKIQWNAMDTVRACKDLPFGDKRGPFQ